MSVGKKDSVGRDVDEKQREKNQENEQEVGDWERK